MNPERKLEDTLVRMVEALESAKIRFHCTGGLAASLYGEPRMTQDIDLVIARDDAAEFGRLLDVVGNQYILDREHALESWRAGRMFRALDTGSYIKIDFHPGEDIPGELRRSVRKEILPGVFAPLVTKEDSILSKLIWIRKGSHKSRQDVIGMFLRTGPLDWKYLESMARQLDVLVLLDEIKQRAGPRDMGEQ